MKKNVLLKSGLLLGWLIGLLTFITSCVPQDGGEEAGFDWTIIIFIVLIFVVFYFLLIRPQRKRQKEHQEMVQELKRGDRVITAGGIYGVIDSISEDNCVLKVESGATIRVAKEYVALRQEARQIR